MSIAALSRAALRPKPTRTCKLSKLLKNPFLQLPPTSTPSRSFHASPRPRFLETIITPAYYLFEGVHSITGLQWAYSIPLTALAIRSVFVLPISIYSRRVQMEQMKLRPVIHAWTPTLQKQVMEQPSRPGPAEAKRELLSKMREKRIEIYQRMGVAEWKNYLPFLHLPVLLVAIEALRMMTGADVGLLGHLASGLTSYSIPLISSTSSLTAWYEPSLAKEGILWFKDLTVADPEGRLSYILSGALIMNILDFGPATQTNPSVWQGRFKRALIAVSCVAGPLLAPLPSGILVYWISSVSFAFVQANVLARTMIVKVFKPCKP